MARQNNRIVCDLNKVQWAEFSYVNQHGHKTFFKPVRYSVYGMAYYDNELAFYHADYLGETVIQRAIRLGILDVWTPQIILKFSANETLVYTGEKAISINKIWCSKIYGKSNRKSTKKS